MFNLKLVSAKDNIVTAKATVRKSGQLGFNRDAAILLDINEKKKVALYVSEDENDKSLYAEVLEEENPEYFGVQKAGEYFFINTRVLFDRLKIDYKNPKITNIYDISPFDYPEKKLFKLSLRTIQKTKKEDSKDSTTETEPEK